MSSSAMTPAEIEPLSEGARIIDSFVAPSKTFQDLRRNTRWWIAFALILASVMLMQFAVIKKVGADRLIENQFARMPKVMEKIEQAGPQKRDEIMAKQVEGAKRGWMTAPIAPAVFILVFAGLMLPSYNFGTGQRLTFSQCLAVTCYAGLPGIIKSLLIVVVAFLAPDTYNPLNPIATNPGYFMEIGSPPFLMMFLSFIDIFAIWTLLLTAFGFTQVSKVKMGTSSAIVFGWYLIIVGVISGLISLVMG